ncbi:hypothetical protein F383_35618 [Gossypium arboreum]|uniref:Uncharacterized protein n=1 Tax=Gossypium arboreum TaxID=29729 RepID=A0A0B0NBB6_GOSAR|nr:hypothetical protein F383_35618 [Gossypium arboreum]
MYRLEYNLKI